MPEEVARRVHDRLGRYIGLQKVWKLRSIRRDGKPDEIKEYQDRTDAIDALDQFDNVESHNTYKQIELWQEDRVNKTASVICVIHM